MHQNDQSIETGMETEFSVQEPRTQEQLRYLIAEAMGWRDFQDRAGTTYGYRQGVGYRDMAIIPDYANDLNAMHQAERWLFRTIPGGECQYQDALVAIMRESSTHAIMAMDCVCADSRQRALAFVRVMEGKGELA